MKRRMISLMLAVVLVLVMLPAGVPAAQAATTITNPSNVSGNTYSVDYAEKLDNIFRGEVRLFSNSSDKLSLGDSINNKKQYLVADAISGAQCYIYAQAVYYYLFGDIPYHGDGYRYWSNSTKIMTNEKSASYELFRDSGVGFGAYLRTTGNRDGSYSGGSGHSMIILAYDRSGITYLEGNADGKGLIRITTRTWDEFNQNQLSGKGRRICHIVQYNGIVTFGTLDINGYLDGQLQESLSGFGTVDVYVDGVLIADDTADHNEDLFVGAEYAIRDIRPAEGYSYDGVYSGSLEGTISGDAQSLVLKFSTIHEDHSYTGQVTAPTCTDQGYTTYTCSVCADSYKGDYTAAAGHSFGQVTVHAPAPGVQGYSEHSCTTCGFTEKFDYVDFQGVSVSGRVTSYLDAAATVELVQDGEVVYTAVVSGDSYTIKGVKSGTYTMVVSKENHASRSYELVVGQEDVTADAQICPLGDVTGDGAVNIKDFQRLLRHVNKTNLLEGYALACGDVTGDGVVNIKDFQRLLRHVNKTNPLF